MFKNNCVLVVVQEGTYILIFIFLNNGAGYCAECSAKSECRTECIADTKIQKSTCHRNFLGRRLEKNVEKCT